MDIEEKLERIFQELMSGETVPARERTKLTCLRWDSLMQLNLVTAIEQEFGITLADDEVVDLNSFAMAVQLVQDKVAHGPRV